MLFQESMISLERGLAALLNNVVYILSRTYCLIYAAKIHTLQRAFHFLNGSFQDLTTRTMDCSMMICYILTRVEIGSQHGR